jgi:hypothetical protein
LRNKNLKVNNKKIDRLLSYLEPLLSNQLSNLQCKDPTAIKLNTPPSLEEKEKQEKKQELQKKIKTYKKEIRRKKALSRSISYTIRKGFKGADVRVRTIAFTLGGIASVVKHSESGVDQYAEELKITKKERQKTPLIDYLLKRSQLFEQLYKEQCTKSEFLEFKYSLRPEEIPTVEKLRAKIKKLEEQVEQERTLTDKLKDSVLVQIRKNAAYAQMQYDCEVFSKQAVQIKQKEKKRWMFIYITWYILLIVSFYGCFF